MTEATDRPGATARPVADQLSDRPGDDRPWAVVTGGGSGIGREIARQLAALGWRVRVIGRNAERLAALCAENPLIESRTADLTDFPYPDLLPERIDALVHAAGTFPRPALPDNRPQDWADTFALNVIAGAELARLAMPALRRSEGTVVMINSGAGVVEKPANTVYGASKHALRILANGLRREEEQHGVRVSTVYPGPTDTAMFDGDVDRNVLIRPETVARVVVEAITAAPDTQLTDIQVRPRRELQ